MIIQKRIPLRSIVLKTKTVFLSFLFGLFLALFVAELFLMNRLSSEGYLLSQEMQKKKALAYENDVLDTKIAVIQTQNFVSRVTSKYQFITKGQQQFVKVPLRITAKK